MSHSAQLSSSYACCRVHSRCVLPLQSKKYDPSLRCKSQHLLETACLLDSHYYFLLTGFKEFFFLSRLECFELLKKVDFTGSSCLSAPNGICQHPAGINWSVVLLSLRGGCVSCYAGRKTLLQRTGRCGRTSPWSGGSSVFLSQNGMPFMSRRAMQCITMATGRPTSSTFLQSRFRFVYLGQFSAARSQQLWT